MFKPGPPVAPSPPPEPVSSEPLKRGARLSLAGLLSIGMGLAALIYGWVVQRAASPSAGDGLVAGLLGGLAASLGQIFISTGWLLMIVGALLWGFARWLRTRTES